MAKIAFIGAGSLGFGRRLVRDIISFPELADSSIHLVDPNQERVSITYDFVTRLIKHNNLPTKVFQATTRESALDGADYVIASIRVGNDLEPEKLDVQIPYETAGLRQTVSDTVGIGGIMKGLRTIPVMLDIARDMETYCPDAVMLNYTNPMAMIMWAIHQETSISAVGLCHSVQGTSRQLSNYMNIDYNQMRYLTAGINHMAWFLDLSTNGEDLYPRLRDCLHDPEIFEKDPVRFEIFKHFSYFVTESSRHMAEYIPYVMPHVEEMERLKQPIRTGETFAKQNETRQVRMKQAVEESKSANLELQKSNEYAATIIYAIETDTPTYIYGNVRNTALITNLLDRCCVEVPCLVNRVGVQGCYVGDLPPQCASLCQSNVSMQGLTVQAILEQKRKYVYHSAMVDPNTASQLTLPQIRTVIDQLLESQKELMPPLG